MSRETHKALPAAGVVHGSTRQEQGYAEEMLAEGAHWVGNLIYEIA
jgi:hypothetical protein